jgi:transcriptional regulator with XRE-family HTH domain
MSVQLKKQSGGVMNVTAIQTDDEGEAIREARAVRFMSILKRHQIPKHGAQTIMAKEIGVSDATIAAWMRGSLPRDPVVLIGFCDAYDVDLYWWVNGVPRPTDGVAVEKLVRASQSVSKWAEINNIDLKEDQRMALIGKIYNDPVREKDILDSMAEVLAY